MAAWTRSGRCNACLRGSRRLGAASYLLQPLRPTLRDDMFERPILFDQVRDAPFRKCSMTRLLEPQQNPPLHLPLYNFRPAAHIPPLMWLSILIPILLVILVVVCLLLQLVVLLPRPRSEGLGAAFGSGMTENIF